MASERASPEAWWEPETSIYPRITHSTGLSGIRHEVSSRRRTTPECIARDTGEKTYQYTRPYQSVSILTQSRWERDSRRAPLPGMKDEQRETSDEQLQCLIITAQSRTQDDLDSYSITAHSMSHRCLSPHLSSVCKSYRIMGVPYRLAHNSE